VNKHGFTLLEVTLFFAISGLLALVAFAGLGPRLRNVRFTDAVRSLESTTERQLSDFKSGTNLRTSNISCSLSGARPSLSSTATGQIAGRSADCIINGRLAVFENESVSFYPVVSSRKLDSTCTTTDATYGDLFCYHPTVLAYSGTVSEISYRNGAKLQGSNLGLLYLQDPNGTETKLMKFDFNQTPTPGTTYHIEKTSDISSLSPPAEICLGLSGRTGKLQYNNSS
jgi:type II secretory pathway pseudopilin PulG